MRLKFLAIGMMLCVFLFYFACSTPQQDTKTVLFNGKDYQGWTFYLADSTVSADSVWSVQEGVVHCKGVPNGFMRTVESFTEYKLHLEWRWVDEPTNSGVLLNCQQPDKIWPNAIECQLMAGNAGDLVLIGPASITVDDSTWSNADGFTIIPKKQESNEKPAGEWNTYDITVSSQKIECSVNGVLQNSGMNPSLSGGPIALQSEGSPIEFRNIWIQK
ncbi:DUF1080 domain-containing protein [candidate division KSB1 bacterium]|nr:DUF1080 domain-containing protein [candidate division KSB1 bacterium]